MTKTTYTCSICHEVNHSARLHCKACGTIPKQYSPIAKPAKETGDYFTAVLVAFGAERQDIGHTCKRLLRTVPMDYYAEV